MNILDAIVWIERLMGFDQKTPWQGGSIHDPLIASGEYPPCIASRAPITGTPARVSALDVTAEFDLLAKRKNARMTRRDWQKLKRAELLLRGTHMIRAETAYVDDGEDTQGNPLGRWRYG